jgi:hypothetical protein
MRTWWLAPLLLTALTLAWYAVQSAWLRIMGQPASADALARPGCAGPDGRGCSCQDPASAPGPAFQPEREVSPS